MTFFLLLNLTNDGGITCNHASFHIIFTPAAQRCGIPPQDVWANAPMALTAATTTILYTCKAGFGADYTVTCTNGVWTGSAPCAGE